jgi:hypothetical protein
MAIEDVASLQNVVDCGDAVYANAVVDGIQILGLRINRGYLIARKGLNFPVVSGKTCLGAFVDASRAKILKYLDHPILAEGEVSSTFIFTGTQNYYHFMVFHLPSLFVLATDERPKVSVTILDGLPRSCENFVTKFISLFARGRPIELVHLKEGDYRLRDVIMPAISNKRLAIKVARFVQSVTFRDAGIDDAIKDLGPIKVFIQRGHSANGRNLINEKEIESWFISRGYVAVNPGTMTLEEQVLLFSRATHIVGTQGAALTNILFATNARDILMIASPLLDGDPFFAGIAARMNVPFRAIKGVLPPAIEGVPRSGGSLPHHLADFLLPLASVEAIAQSFA